MGHVASPLLVNGTNAVKAPPEIVTSTGDGWQDVQNAVDANYKRLTAGQRKAIDRLLADTRYAAVISAPELAQEVGVSESTITLAAQALGFAGYPDLQARLRERFFGGVQERIAHVARLGETPETAAIRVMLEDAETVRMTAEDLPLVTLSAATEILVNARRVYVFGARGSHGVAVMLGIGLRLLLPDTHVLNQGAGDLEDQLITMGPQDALIAVSFRRLDRIMVNVVRHASQLGARTIVISDQLSSPATRLADLTLIARVGPLRLIPSFAAAASLVNALLTAVSLRTLDDSSVRLERAERLWQEFDTYAES